MTTDELRERLEYADTDIHATMHDYERIARDAIVYLTERDKFLERARGLIGVAADGDWYYSRRQMWEWIAEYDAALAAHRDATEQGGKDG